MLGPQHELEQDRVYQEAIKNMRAEVTEFEAQRWAAADSARVLLQRAAAHMAAAEAAEVQSREQQRIEQQVEAAEAALFATAASNSDEWEGGWEEEEQTKEEEDRMAGERVKNMMRQQNAQHVQLHEEEAAEDEEAEDEEAEDEEAEDEEAEDEEAEDEEAEDVQEDEGTTVPGQDGEETEKGEQEQQEQQQEQEEQEEQEQEEGGAHPMEGSSQLSGLEDGDETPASSRGSAGSVSSNIAPLLDQIQTAIEALAAATHITTSEGSSSEGSRASGEGACPDACEKRLAALEAQMSAQQASMALTLMQLRLRLDGFEKAQAGGH
jgi:exosome complex component RRP41